MNKAFSTEDAWGGKALHVAYGPCKEWRTFIRALYLTAVGKAFFLL